MTRTTRSLSAFSLLAVVGLGVATTGSLANGSPKAPPAAPAAPAAPATPALPAGSTLTPLSPAEVEKLKLNQPAAKPAPAAPVALPPALEMGATTFDWGSIPDTDPVSHTFKFKNITDKTIKIAVSASCGCTVGKLAKDTLAPGEEGDATATFNPAGRTGAQTKQLTVTVTEPQGMFAQQTMTLSSNVRALVQIEPQKTFLTDVDHREGQQAKLTITVRKADTRLAAVESNNEFIKATLGETTEETENNEKISKTVVNLDVGKGAPIGSLNGQLVLRTSDAAAKPVTTFVGADVIGDIRATPPSTMIRAAAPGAAITAQMKIDTRSGKAFKVMSLELDGRSDLKLVADFSPSDDGKTYMITVSGVAPDQPGLVQGAIVVGTDSEGGESIRVPFTMTVPRTPGAAKAAAPAPAAPQPAPVQPATGSTNAAILSPTLAPANPKP